MTFAAQPLKAIARVTNKSFVSLIIGVALIRVERRKFIEIHRAIYISQLLVALLNYDS